MNKTISNKLKLAGFLIFACFLPVGGIIYAVAVSNFGFFDWRTFSFAFIPSIATAIIFSLTVDFLLSFPLKDFGNRLQKDWKEKHVVSKTKNAPLEIIKLSEIFSSILEEIEEKDTALQAANKLDKLKYDFITIASHQLRTPLTEVSWFLELLESSPAVKSDPKLSEVLESAKGGVKNVSNMTNQLLSVLQISTTDELKKTGTVDIEQILRETIAQSKAPAKARDVRIIFEKSAGVIPVVSGDEKLLKFVFQNILANAIYYGHENKPLVIRLTHRGENIQIDVEDEGTIIKPEERNLVFEKFFRGAEAKQIRPDGWGLALYLVKQIIVWHGGEIVCGSLDNGKTVFTVKLPVNAHGELQKFITNY